MRRVRFAEPMPAMAPRRGAVADARQRRASMRCRRLGRAPRADDPPASRRSRRRWPAGSSSRCRRSPPTSSRRQAKRDHGDAADGSGWRRPAARGGGAGPGACRTRDGRVVLVDFPGDGANASAIGEGADLPGFADLFDGNASFAEVIFRDRRSRVHFVPAGTRRADAPSEVADERLETILSALTLTYDHVVLDARDDVIAPAGGTPPRRWWSANSRPADPRTDARLRAHPRRVVGSRDSPPGGRPPAVRRRRRHCERGGRRRACDRRLTAGRIGWPLRRRIAGRSGQSRRSRLRRFAVRPLHPADQRPWPVKPKSIP